MSNKSLNKTAEGISPPITWDVVNQMMRERAAKKIVPQLTNIGMGAAGLGASIAGIQHLLKLRDEQRIRDSELSSQDRPVRILAKRSGVASTISDFVSDMGKGTYAREPYHFPAFIPTATGVGLAAGYSGYKLTDALLDRLKSQAKQREVARAEEEYTQALTGASGKMASDRCKLAQDVDRILAALSKDGRKLAGEPGDSHRLLSALAGLYLAGMGLTGAYGLQKGYKAQQAASKTRAVERAQLEKQMQQRKDFVPVIATQGTPPV